MSKLIDLEVLEYYDDKIKEKISTAQTTAQNNAKTTVTNTLATTTKAYVTGTKSATTNTGSQVFDTGVYLDTTAGTLVATKFKGNLIGNADTATTATSATKATTAETVNGYTVESNVPANAKFTDTTYSVVTTSANGLMSSTDKTKLDYTNIAYGTCATAAATAAKVVTISGNSNWTLQKGSIILVKYTYTNTASSVTLNVNSTGAKQIWYSNAVYTSTGNTITGTANRNVMYMYDGTYWVWISSSVDNNTDTKVTNTLATTTKAYVTGTTSATTNTGTQVFDTGVYLDTTAGTLTATNFKGALSGNATTATTATKATALSSTSIGSATQPVYIDGDGKPVATTYTLASSVPSSAKFTDTVTTVTSLGTGNAVTAITASSGKLTVTKGSTFLTEHPSVSTSSTATVIKTLKHGETFTAIQNVTTDSNGHITTTTANNFTLPSQDEYYLSSSAGNIELEKLSNGTRTTTKVQPTIYYAECDDTRDTLNKVIDCDDFVLEKGVMIAVKFTAPDSTNPTSGTFTLNINNTGAKEIIIKNTSYKLIYGNGWYFQGGYIWLFMYDGTQYIMLNQDANTSYSPMTLGFGYGTCATAESTTAKVITLASYVLVKNGIVSVKFTYAVPANATMNINSKGAKNIFYHGSKITAGIISAGDIATFIYDGTQYQLLTIDKSYLATSGGTMTGALVAQTNTNYTTAQVRNATMSTDEVSGGTNGQIHFQYT